MTDLSVIGPNVLEVKRSCGGLNTKIDKTKEVITNVRTSVDDGKTQVTTKLNELVGLININTGKNLTQMKSTCSTIIFAIIK